MKFDNVNIAPCAIPNGSTCAGTPPAVTGSCDDPAYRVTHPDCPDIPNCADPAYALAHPELCPNMPKLIIKPDVAVLGTTREILYSTFLYADGRENPIEEGVIYTTSDPTIAVIGTITGSLTAIRPGSVTVTATYGVLTATANLVVVMSCFVEPMAVAICIDQSKSMSNAFSGSAGTRLNLAKTLASSFVGCMNLSKDFVSVLEFDSSAVITQPITQNGAAVLAQISAIQVGRASTNVALAMNTASAHLKEKVGTSATHVIFLLTDFENKEGDNPILASRELRSGGTIIIVASLRSSGFYFRQALQSASGGFFANITPTNEADASAMLNGLKTHICSGACASTVSVIGPMGALNYTNFNQWEVSSGAVDFIGDGSGLFYDVVPGHGMYVDMIGTLAGDGRGTLRQRTAVVYEVGVANQITFELAGNNRQDRANDVITMSLIDNDNNIFASQDYSIPFDQPFLGYAFNFTLGGGDPTSLRLQFTQTSIGLADLTNNVYGCLLDNILVTNDAGTILLYENFENDNLVELPATCSATTIDTQYPYLAPFDCNAPGVQCVSSIQDCVQIPVYCVTVSGATDPVQGDPNGVYTWEYFNGEWEYVFRNSDGNVTSSIRPNDYTEGQTEVPPQNVPSGWRLSALFDGCYLSDSTDIFGSWSLSGAGGCTATNPPTIVPSECFPREVCPPPFITAYSGNCAQGCGCVYASPGSQIPDAVQLPELETQLPDHVDRWTATATYRADCRSISGLTVAGAGDAESNGTYYQTSPTTFTEIRADAGDWGISLGGDGIWRLIHSNGSTTILYQNTTGDLFGTWTPVDGAGPAPTVTSPTNTDSKVYTSEVSQQDANAQALALATQAAIAGLICSPVLAPTSSILYNFQFVDDPLDWYPAIPVIDALTGVQRDYTPAEIPLVLASGGGAIDGGTTIANSDFWNPVAAFMVSSIQPQIPADSKSGGLYFRIPGLNLQFSERLNFDNNGTRWKTFRVEHPNTLMRTYAQFYAVGGGAATISINIPVGGLIPHNDHDITVAVIGHGILDTDVATWDFLVDGVSHGVQSTDSGSGWKAAALVEGTHFVLWETTVHIGSGTTLTIKTTPGTGSIIQGFQIGFTPS